MGSLKISIGPISFFSLPPFTFLLTKQLFLDLLEVRDLKKRILPYPVGAAIIGYWTFRERWELIAFFHEICPTGNPN